MRSSSRQRRTPARAGRVRDTGTHSRLVTPAAVIEAQLSPQGDPVLGLYLHIAYLDEQKVPHVWHIDVGRRAHVPGVEERPVSFLHLAVPIAADDHPGRPNQ